MMMFIILHKQTTEQKMVMEMDVEKRGRNSKDVKDNYIYNTYVSFVGKTNVGEKMSEIISSLLTWASGYTYLQWCH